MFTKLYNTPLSCLIGYLRHSLIACNWSWFCSSSLIAWLYFDSGWRLVVQVLWKRLPLDLFCDTCAKQSKYHIASGELDPGMATPSASERETERDWKFNCMVIRSWSLTQIILYYYYDNNINVSLSECLQCMYGYMVNSELKGSSTGHKSQKQLINFQVDWLHILKLLCVKSFYKSCKL